MTAVNNYITSFKGSTTNVFAFGATGDGETDDLAAFTDALAYSQHVIVPPGTYRVSDTIVVEGSGTIANARHLELAAGAYIKRFDTDASTNPVIRLGGNHARLTGLGVIESDNASPRGVVCVGPDDQIGRAHV